MSGRQTGGGQFVVRRIRESDRRRHEPIPERLGHVGHDQARVDAAGQECAKRHFALEPIRDGRAERLVHGVDQGALGALIGVELGDVPVSPGRRRGRP